MTPSLRTSLLLQRGRLTLTAVLVGTLAVFGFRVAAGAVGAAAPTPAQTFYVATDGSDANAGTSADQPVRTLTHAQQLVRDALAAGAGAITVEVRGDTYHLSGPLSFGLQDSGSPDAPVVWKGIPNGDTEQDKVTLSGGRLLSPTWSPVAGEENVQVSDVPAGLDFDELFVNGQRQILARYPNYDPSIAKFGGSTTLADLNARSAGWAHPELADVRSLHCLGWGGASFTVTGRDASGLQLEWVGDNNRPLNCPNPALPYDQNHMVAENVREELDAPGEWYYDGAAGKLYYYPAEGVSLDDAKVETGELDQLIQVVGQSNTEPAHDITFTGFRLTESHRTLFNAPDEARGYHGLQLGDWSVRRTGAFYTKNAQNITVTDSFFDQLGGNGVFMDGYNKANVVSNSHFDGDGATDVQVVGSRAAVWNPSTWGDFVTELPQADPPAGPKTEDYPRDILISNNLMEHMGKFEKQSGGVNISVSARVTDSKNTIHDSPRSCVNIEDGTFGGHLIQDNDIFRCVLETTDHGPINAWGRDRYWPLSDDSKKKQYAFLDVIEPNTIDHNRIWYDAHRDIDLDDGSSNYIITNNLLLNAGIKLRDGFRRTVKNNILVNGTIYEQVSFPDNEDVIDHNIVLSSTPYNLIQSDPATAKYAIDHNLFWNNGSDVTGLGGNWAANGLDANSKVADPLFVNGNPWENPAMLDYTVADGSPAIDLGFTNFPMANSDFGADGYDNLLPPPVYWNQSSSVSQIQAQHEELMGATVTGISDDSVQSSVGLGDWNGLYLQDVPAGSYAAGQGLQTGDVIRKVNGSTVTDRTTFWYVYNKLPAGAEITLSVWRDQAAQDVQIVKTDQPEQLNDTSGVVYVGNTWDWKNSDRGGAQSYLDDIWAASTIGDSFSLTFNGTGLDIITETYSNEGQIEVTIDGGTPMLVDCTSADRVFQSTVASITGLAPGVHTLTGVMKTGAHLIVDAFRTHPAGSDEPPAGGSGSETITTEVAQQGGLTMSVADSSPVVLPSPLLSSDGASLTTSGAMNPVTVTDMRPDSPGWNVTAQAGEFATGEGASFRANALGWSPSVLDQADGQQVAAGAAVVPGGDGGGLSTARTLASAPAGSAVGTAHVGAELQLSLPTDTALGSYTATMTLTAI